jgi:two-component system OmpR family response regulator
MDSLNPMKTMPSATPIMASNTDLDAPTLGQKNKTETLMRILVIEDDREAAEYLVKGLRESGYAVDHAANGKDGLFLALSEPYDVMVVDRMLPGPDGLSIVESVRKSNIATPVLFLSALGEVEDRIAGLKAGGDDYLAKPYSFSELLARVEALLRRAGTQPESTFLSAGDLEMDLLSRKVTRQGKRVYLHPREFRLLEYLMRHAGQVVTRTMLLENVWEYHFDPQTNVIDVHISRLRQKIDKPFDKPILETVRGAGYKLDV